MGLGCRGAAWVAAGVRRLCIWVFAAPCRWSFASEGSGPFAAEGSGPFAAEGLGPTQRWAGSIGSSSSGTLLVAVGTGARASSRNSRRTADENLNISATWMQVMWGKVRLTRLSGRVWARSNCPESGELQGVAIERAWLILGGLRGGG